MNLEIGVVCGECDAYSPMGTARCRSCKHDLALFPAKTGAYLSEPPLSSSGTLKPAAFEDFSDLGDSTSQVVNPFAESGPMRTGSSPNNPAAGPFSERRAGRPQAPDIRPGVSPPSNSPKVEVVRHPASAKKNDAAWGPQTTGKIPAGMPVGTKGRSKEELMDQWHWFFSHTCAFHPAGEPCDGRRPPLQQQNVAARL